ncbi:hypothetical protein JRO89_XSUnG0158400 [Xanthoceras sorbifolium]|uniref:Plastocyanin-like domain-containing protein n=1 Tax=Xanthoceras sorbifolium TaxID=99658 RepID=A0ABQ8GZA1_9ROSI|nr:hypothetical protein JRO89_XSUnG0158400 [Xanthoceras sorbifolium]
MSTTSPLLGREVRFGGMHTYPSSDQLSMVPSSFFQSKALLIHLSNLTNKSPSFLDDCIIALLKLKVKPGKTYLFRLINAALNDELFFNIANHTFKVVEVDAVYVKPFDTETLLITPGQTTNVLLNTKSHYPSARFLMNARPYVTGLGTFDNSTVAGILEYEKPPHSRVSIGKLRLFKPILPPLNDTSFATNFTNKLHSLASAQFPANVPQNVDKRFFFTVGLGTSPCQSNQTC